MPAVAATDGPVLEISVAQLYLQGMGDLAVADLNSDGLLNTADIAAFLAGARPDTPDVAFTGNDGGSWFDDANWAGNGKPNAETNIAITKTVLVDREGAVARNVTVKSGGTLDLINGTLSARSLTVDAQGTLRLSGMASLLQVQSLILREVPASSGTAARSRSTVASTARRISISWSVPALCGSSRVQPRSSSATSSSA